MKKSLNLRGLVFTLVAICLLQSPITSAEVKFNRMCVFGDSLSDSGNVFKLTHTYSTAPYDLIPSAPYSVSGKTFSNGATWIQKLARSLDMRRSAAPAFRKRGIFCNYAFGTARARTTKPFDFSGQVSFYLGDFGATHSDGTLFVVQLGGNDIRDAIEAFAADPTGATSQQILTDAITELSDNLLALYGLAGATNFLVTNAPDLSVVPAITLQGPQVQFLAKSLSDSYNSALDSALDQFETLPDVQVTRFDVASFIQDLITNPPKFIKNTTDSCITPNTVIDPVCEFPRRYIFWDGIHPTTSTHKLFAEAVEIALDIPN